jgi:hypothetical protein
MAFARIWLALNGVLFLVYGLVCVVAPNLPAGYAELVLPTATARTEVSAMYGGLQAGLGALLCWSAMRPERVAHGLVVLVVLIGSLALGRAYGIVANGATAYNVGAIVYEATAAGLGFVAWRLVTARSVPA